MMLAQCTPVTGPPLPPCAVVQPAVKRYTLGKGRIAVIEQIMSYGRDDGFLVIRGWQQLQIGKKRVTVPEFKWRGFEYAYAHLAQVRKNRPHQAILPQEGCQLSVRALQTRSLILYCIGRGSHQV